MSQLGMNISFWLLAVLTLVSGFFVVARRNVLHSGFWLLPCFLGIAGLYALLEAHFFVMVQVLIYVGAILVLIIFALMLTRDVMSPFGQTNRLAGWAALLCSALALGAIYATTKVRWPLTAESPLGPYGQTAELGNALIGRYVVPFEVASLLLVGALFGAIVLAKSERESEPAAPPLPLEETDQPAEEACAG